ncbi:MAG TPA: ABC transporter permease, partial [Longimicrobiales bacterium]|nr:ABC transporter permease [Longimicrobiales bacterium]
FGDERRYRAELERSAVRVSRRRRMLEAWRTIGCAVTAALRGVRRAPGLSAAVVATLALGLGANAAIFRVVDRLLLSPPPHIERPDEVRRLFRIVQRMPGDEPSTIDAFTYADVTAMRAAAPDVPLGVIMSYVPETVGAGDDAVRLQTARVDAGYFPLLGVQPVMGRGLLPEDHRTGAAVVVLSHAAWLNHFGGDEAILGRRIRAARGEYEVVGVLPPGFHGSHAAPTDLWIPLEAEAEQWWGADWRTTPDLPAFDVLARVPPSVPMAAWETRLADALRAMPQGPVPMEILSVTTSSLVPGSVPNPTGTVSVFRWLAGVSLLVLLIACANTANLFLAHAERHRRETAVRRALGAGTALLRIELFARTLCLALLGAGAAVLLAFWGGSLLERVFPTGLAPTTGRLIVFTAGLGILAALLAGLLPALRTPRDEMTATLAGGGRTTGGTGSARRTLAGVQVALCMLLLVGAGLFVTSFRNATRVDLGFDHERLIMLRVERDDGVDIPRAQLLDAAAERLRALPSVVSTSGTVAVPFALLYGMPTSLPDGDRIADLHVNAVGPDFFRTMDMSVERGRAFDERDTREGAAPVIIVSRRAAERLWPGHDPIGECLRVGEDGPCGQVVGIAGDHAGVTFGPDELAPAATMQAWVPFGFPGAQSASSLLVRTTVPPAQVLDDVRRTAAVPGLRYVETEMLSDVVGQVTRSWRLGATIFSLFGLIALLVAGVGLYGVLSFEVAQRRREFGIRIALGAGRLRALLPVMRFAAPVVTLGLLAGGTAALLGADRIGPLLFDVEPHDPLVLALAALTVAAAAGIALLVPAWRAANVDPRETLG